MIQGKFKVDTKQKEEPVKTEQKERSDTQKIYHFCYNYYNENKRFPKIAEIINNTKLKHKQITIILKALVSKKYIKKIGNRYYFPDQKVTRAKKKRVIKKTMNKTHFLKDKLFYFKIILLVVFTAFLYMGIKYNYIGFVESKSKPDAIIAAVGFIFIGIILFEFGIYFLKKNRFLSVLLFILFLIIFVNNFFNIFKGQFTKYQDLVYNTKHIEKENKIKLLDSYEEQIKEYQKELELQYDFIEKYKDNDKYYWQLHGARNKYIPKLKEDMEIVIKKKELLLEENVNTIKEKTIFQFVSDIINKNKDISNILQFIYLLFPGFIVELIINISLALFFYVENNKKVL